MADSAPVLTYRIQVSRAFDLRRVGDLLPYLHKLGVSHLHLSPLYKAMPGSNHGYDVIDHSCLNPDVGTEEELQKVAEGAQQLQMGLILDLVPNHMCIASAANRQWQDVLENGPSAAAAAFFDIDWGPPKAELVNKVLLPILGAQFGFELERGALEVIEQAGVFVLRYGSLMLPLAPPSWQLILQPWWKAVRAQEGQDGPNAIEIESILRAVTHWPTDGGPRAWRHEREAMARRITQLCQDDQVAQELERQLVLINGTPGEPSSFDRLEQLIGLQHYRLANWRVAAHEINYRRFFDVDALAAIRVDDDAVFDAVHALPQRWLANGWLSGFRIDHVDGLREPQAYLDRLRDLVPHKTPYVVVEKILSPGESLPDSWSASGTTGYEHLASVANVLVDVEQAWRVREAWRTLTGSEAGYKDVAYESKRLILGSSFAGELTVLGRRLDRLSEQHRYSRDFTLASLTDCLREVIACFPVYRTYVTESTIDVTDRDARMITLALEEAQRRNPVTNQSLFDFMHDVLMLRDPGGLTADQMQERKDFVLRFQQLTGPVTAKGLEDTAFYRYFPLLGLSEVGVNPDHLGVSVDEFHFVQRLRAETRPKGLSASATHDTKRGEDARARLCVLSEIAPEWVQTVLRWRELNAPLRVHHAGKYAPDDITETFIYQSLLGGCPPEGLDVSGDFPSRFKASLHKALAEAKRDTSWTNPDKAYEAAIDRYVDALLSEEKSAAFLADFRAFFLRLKVPGVLNSLAQVILKFACPGVPELYQGTEGWDHSFVDPDNRRPVAFETLGARLSAVADAPVSAEQVAMWLQKPDDGLIKMLVTQRCAQLRHQRAAALESHRYEVCRVWGPLARHVVAFARGYPGQRVIALVGRLFGELSKDGVVPTGKAWSETFVDVAELIPQARYVNVLTGEAIIPGTNNGAQGFALDQTFTTLPFALIREET